MASPTEQNKDPTLNLKTICTELRTISHKWFTFGVQLGIPRHVLEKFEKEEQDPLSAVVDYALKGNETDPPRPISWKSVVKALQSIGDTGLAENVNKKYCSECAGKVKQDAGKPSAEKPRSESPAGILDPVVQKNLEFILEENLKKIIAQYASYVDNLRAAIEEKKVSPKALQTYLLSMTFYSKNEKGEILLTPISDKKSELEKQETIADIFSFLTTECATFLNYEIFENIGDKFGYSNREYHKQLQNFAKKHKISEIAKKIPLPKPKIGATELVLKFDVDQTCRLSKVLDLQKSIAKVLKILPSALQILSIKDGCVVVTFIIPTSIATHIFTADTVFTPQQEDELLAASILWMKCNGQTFHFRKQKALEKIKQQLICSVCTGFYTNPKLLQCHHAFCQQCLDRLVQQDEQGQFKLTCPTCRQVTPVPASGVAGLQADFRTKEFVEIVEEDEMEVVTTTESPSLSHGESSYQKSHKQPIKAKQQLHREANIVDPITKGFDLRSICNALASIKDQWFNIGIQLGIPYDQLEEFKWEDDPLPVMVNYWLKGNVTESVVPISWKSIVEVLNSEFIGKPELAEDISKKHCTQLEAHHAVDVSDSEDDNTNEQIDIEIALETNLEDISLKYANYIDCLRTNLAKHISVSEVQSFLISLPVHIKGNKRQKLALISSEQLLHCYTLSSVFTFLTTNLTSFLNYDIFETLRKKYLSNEESEELNYYDHLKAYIYKHKVSELVKINPKLKKYATMRDTAELILKFDIETTCAIGKVADLRKTIAKILGISSSALHIIDIKEGCIIVTFLIPTSVANVLFTPDTVFTPQQEDQLQAVSVLWMKCNGYTFQFQDRKFQSPQIQALKKAEEQLAPPFCHDHTDPEFVQCGHAYSQQPMKKEAGEIEIYPQAITVE